MAAGLVPVPYDGTSSFPDACPPAQSSAQRALALAVTALIVAGRSPG